MNNVQVHLRLGLWGLISINVLRWIPITVWRQKMVSYVNSVPARSGLKQVSFKKIHYPYICKLCLLTETSTLQLVCLKKERKKMTENKHKNYVYDNTIHFTWFYIPFYSINLKWQWNNNLKTLLSGKCPIYSGTGKLDAKICQATSSRECPTKVYKSNVNFNCKYMIIDLSWRENKRWKR